MTTHDESFTTHNLDEQLKLPDQRVDERRMTPNEQVVHSLHDFYSVQAQEEQQRTQRVYARLKAATAEDAFFLSEEHSHLVLLPLPESAIAFEKPERRRRPVPVWFQTVAAILVAALLIGGFLATLSLVRQHKNGATASWQVMASANTNANLQTLTGVAVISKQDAWAIGISGAVVFAPNVSGYRSGLGASLFEHWNGQQWSIIPGPQLKDQVLLTSITAVSSLDVWAVGTVGNVGTVVASKQGTKLSTLIEHWNGRQWSVVTSPSPGKAANVLTGVKALSTNNIWAVGNSIDDARTDIAHTLVEHWNGQQWSVIPSPNPGSYQTLQGISVRAANDIWSVGLVQRQGTVDQTLIEHWNGQQWSIVDSPGPGTMFNNLTGVVAISATDVWATGTFSNGGSTNPMSKTLIEHWNGQHWSVVASPSPGSIQNNLLSVAATGENEIWAMGYMYDGKSYKALVEHWNGQQWSSGAMLKVRSNEMYQLLTGIAYDAQSHQLWAVGASGTLEPPSARTLIVTLPMGR